MNQTIRDILKSEKGDLDGRQWFNFEPVPPWASGCGCLIIIIFLILAFFWFVVAS